MPRPKLGETDTERLQLKITTAEIEAIDDWRFANRISSRSEAVRRLCQVGLLCLHHLDGISDAGNEGMKAYSQLSADLEEAGKRHKDDVGYSDFAESVAIILFNRFRDLSAGITTSHNMIQDLVAEINAMFDKPNMKEAMLAAFEERRKSEELWGSWAGEDVERLRAALLARKKNDP